MLSALLPFVFAIVLALLGIFLATRYLFDKEYMAYVSRLQQSATLMASERLPAITRNLPAPVRNYFKYSNVFNKELPPRFVKITIEGKTRNRENENWTKFKATHYMIAQQPSFVWIERYYPNRLVTVKRCQAYIEGQRHKKRQIYGGLLQKDKKNEKIDQTGLIRYLVEVPLFPVALLPGKHLHWEESEGLCATLSIQEGSNVANAECYFNRYGELACLVSKPAKSQIFGTIGKEWEAVFEDYQDFDGIKVPTNVELTWVYASSRYCYRKYKVTGVTYL